jgi:mannose-6-phosphate isomerase-like protein (cupin superfamily)
VQFRRATLLPLTRAAHNDWTCCDQGTEINYVVSGSLSLRAEGPLQITRADGRREEIDPGTMVDLTAGDAAIYDLGSPRDFENRTPEPVELLDVVISPLGVERILPAGMTLIANDWLNPPLRLSSPLTVTIARQEVPVDSPLPATSEGDVRLAIAEVDSAGERLAEEVTLPAAGDYPPDTPVTVYRLSLRPADINLVPTAPTITSRDNLEDVAPGDSTAAPTFAPAAREPITRERLLDVTVGDLPTGLTWILMEEWTTEPGAEVLTNPLAGPAVYLVAEGQFEFSALGEVAVTRAASAMGGPSEQVASGTAVALAPGDWLFVPSDAAHRFQNTGEAPGKILAFGIVDPMTAHATWDPMVTVLEVIASAQMEPLPVEGAHLRVERISLAPGANLPAEATQGFELYGMEDGLVTRIVTRPAGDALDPMTPEAGPNLPVTGLNFLLPGMVREYRNEGETPAVFLLMTVEPEENL